MKEKLTSLLIGLLMLAAPLGYLMAAEIPVPTPTVTPPPTPVTTSAVPLSPETSAGILFLLAMAAVWYIMRSKRGA